MPTICETPLNILHHILEKSKSQVSLFTVLSILMLDLTRVCECVCVCACVYCQTSEMKCMIISTNTVTVQLKKLSKLNDSQFKAKQESEYTSLDFSVQHYNCISFLHVTGSEKFQTQNFQTGDIQDIFTQITAPSVISNTKLCVQETKGSTSLNIQITEQLSQELWKLLSNVVANSSPTCSKQVTS